MYTLISIFYISIIGIAVMLFLKSRENSTGKANIVSRLGKGTDPTFHQVFSGARKGASYFNRHTLIALAHWTAYHVLYRIRNVYVSIKSRVLENSHGRKILDAVRGRGEITTHGVSLYLRRISADGGK